IVISQKSVVLSLELMLCLSKDRFPCLEHMYITRERRWREVTAVFSFPSTATNASFVLRKYYMSLLQHYEQIYFFQAKGWIPSSADSLWSTPQVPLHPVQPMAEIQAAAVQPERINSSEYLSRATQVPPTGFPVMGVIDGKFESGYLVTVMIGSEKLKGVLYQVPRIPVCQHPSPPLHHGVYAQNNYVNPAPPVLRRRRRRKKSEMKKRDPSHPKPNRSGYNFFFAEQHARLKPANPGKDREISRMIGELWNKLTESEKAVYQDKAVKDKERYRIEMEIYKERLKAGEIIRSAIPLQQQPLDLDANMAERSKKIETNGGDSQTQENEIGSGTSDTSDSENYDDTVDMDSDMETSQQVDVGGENTDMGISVGKEGAQLQERVDKQKHACMGKIGKIFDSIGRLASINRCYLKLLH
ncbi:hypothetical protein NMG60_11031792, partial [Bertholletia excelsa]